ncbi:MAG: hypothetical protein QOD00_4252 [Blastocatellia bacterium]|nr:hypothetical protein [Blastocatellia bacterium]
MPPGHFIKFSGAALFMITHIIQAVSQRQRKIVCSL